MLLAIAQTAITLPNNKIIQNKIHQIFWERQLWKTPFAWNRSQMKLGSMFLQMQPGKTKNASEFVVFHLLLTAPARISFFL